MRRRIQKGSAREMASQSLSIPVRSTEQRQKPTPQSPGAPTVAAEESLSITTRCLIYGRR
jgi:hypothetical protein